jgi:hypothetical protein
VPFDGVVAEADELQRRLESLLEESPLPERTEHDAVNRFLVDTYRAWSDRMDGSHAQKRA